MACPQKATQTLSGYLKGGGAEDRFAGLLRERHPAWPGWEIIDALMSSKGGLDLTQLTELQALARPLIIADYWRPLKLSDVYSQRVAGTILTIALERGAHQASRMVCRAINYMVDLNLVENTTLCANDVAIINGLGEILLNQVLVTLHAMNYLWYVDTYREKRSKLCGWMEAAFGCLKS